MVPPINAKPIISSIFIMMPIYSLVNSKRYIILLFRLDVDKYLLVILIFLVAGMLIATTRSPFIPELFYSMLGGALIIIIYGMVKGRREKQAKRREKRRSKK